eukprot:8883150-Lingulodinium_polyedra.AAC.1
MRAVCGKHENCTKSRARKANESPGHEAQGRPVGLLWARLSYGLRDECRTKEDRRAYVRRHEVREQARAEC